MRGRGRASFKGISFLVTTEETESGGLRLVKHNYPFKNEHGIDDFGQKIGTFTVRALFLGADYISRYKRFMAALKADATGELVHPWHARGKYHAEDFNGHIEPAVQRGAYVDLTLVPVGTDASPTSSTNSVTSVMGAINETIDSAVGTFSAAWQVVDDIADTFDALTNITDTLSYGINQLMGGGRVFDLAGQISSIKDNAVSLITRPSELATRLTRATLGFRNVTSNNEAYTIYNGMARRILTVNETRTQNSSVVLEDVPLPITGITPLARDAASEQNVTALQNLMQTVLICCHALTVVEALTTEIDHLTALQKPRAPELTTYIPPIIKVDGDLETITLPNIKTPIITKLDAVEVLWGAADSIEQLTYKLSIDEGDFLALMDLRIKFIADIERRIEKLVGTRTVVANSTKPALVLLYETKQDARLIDEFIRRNGLKNPLFCMANESFEVLEND